MPAHVEDEQVIIKHDGIARVNGAPEVLLTPTEYIRALVMLGAYTPGRRPEKTQ